MRYSLLSVAALASLTCLVACADDEPGAPAFNSSQALNVAPPLKYGCAYELEESSSYGTYHSSKKTPKCEENVRCDEIETPDSAYGYGAGAEFRSFSYKNDEKNFFGTCDDHHDIGPTTGNSSCDTAPIFCLADPNCTALRDCVFTCAETDTA